MIDVDELVNEFKFVGVEVSEEIINKCLEVCKAYSINAEAFVEEWVAFAETNLSGKLQPSLQTVDMMVRKQFVKQEKINIKQEDSDTKVYNPSISTEMKNILNTYNAGNTKDEDIQNGDSKSSPAIQKLSGSQSSAAYAKRTDAGIVLLKFGTDSLLDQTKDKPAQNQLRISVELLETQSAWDAHSSRFMFDNVEVEANALQTRMNRIGQVLVQKHSLDEPVDELTQQGTNVITTIGRIRCDGDGRLNSSSVLVEKISPNTNGFSAIVNLKNIPKYSLFPGQIVAMRTKIIPGNRYTLIPEAVFTDATPELSAKVPIIPGPLRIVVACGPFTLSDNLRYQPLDDLVKHVVNNQANVLILVGPFVDVRHASVSNGAMAETFRGHFEAIVDNFMSQLQHLNVEVVLIPSHLDAHHFNIYPTPAFDLNNKYENLHFMPDPSVISLNGLVVALTSADVLFHLARVELNCAPHTTDRMARFISHILSQQSFYPLYPPQTTPGAKLNVDQGMLEQHAKLPMVPHILILPSNFGYFVKNVNDCIVVNPERLAKGYVGGTFACIDVHPIIEEGSINDNITCQIIKI